MKISAFIVILVVVLSACSSLSEYVQDFGKKEYVINDLMVNEDNIIVDKENKPVNGIVYSYNNKENLIKKSNIKNGKADGLTVLYDSNFKKRAEATYSEGKINGTMNWFDENEKILFKMCYENDKLYKLNAYTNEQLDLALYFIGKNQQVDDKIYAITSFNNEQEIDTETYDKIKQILHNAVKKYKAKSASFILMDASDATVLSSYTTEKIKRSDNLPCIIKGYEPGSILKVFTVAMGLDSGVIKPTDKIDASEPLKLESSTVYDYRSENRELGINEILIYSSNIASAKIALKVGAENQREFLKEVGVLKEIDNYGLLSRELIIPDNKTEERIAAIGYGYEISTSPLHIITAYSAIINGGVYHEPSLQKVKDKKSVRVISKKTSDLMKKYLREVVTQGTAKKANMKDIEFMAKTGTANKKDKDGKYMKKNVITSIVGNFELKGKRYAIIVLLDEPKGIKETFGFATAGWNVAPTAKEIIETIAKREE